MLKEHSECAASEVHWVVKAIHRARLITDRFLRYTAEWFSVALEIRVNCMAMWAHLLLTYLNASVETFGLGSKQFTASMPNVLSGSGTEPALKN